MATIENLAEMTVATERELIRLIADSDSFQGSTTDNVGVVILISGLRLSHI